MGTQNTDLYDFQTRVTDNKGEFFGTNFHGILRVARFDKTNLAADTDTNSIINLAQLPPGRVLLLGRLCRIYHNLTTGSQLLNIGWAAYTDIDGSAVNASVAGLDADIDVDTAGSIDGIGTVLAATSSQTKLFESRSGVTITASPELAVVLNDDINGYLVYVQA